MRVGIVGAGMAGLGAARSLRALGHEAVVFEASNEAGGRVATETVGDFVFDSGATTIAPRGLSLESVMLEEIDASDLCEVELPMFVHTGLRVSSGETLHHRVERFCYRNGNQTLPNLLAQDVDVRFGKRVEELGKSDSKYVCADEEFDAIILTPPAPESRALLLSVGESRPLSNATYRSCLCVLLGYDVDFPNPRYHAILDPEQRHPMTWLSIESAKCPGRAPGGSTAMLVQLGPDFSRRNFDSVDETIVATTVEFVARLYGRTWQTPIVSKVIRWRHSHPENTASFESANEAGDLVLVAGDGVMGARVEFAYETGVRAAKMLTGRKT